MDKLSFAATLGIFRKIGNAISWFSQIFIYALKILWRAHKSLLINSVSTRRRMSRIK
jgi:hypothetical protein